jgi:hypothetical protein
MKIRNSWTCNRISHRLHGGSLRSRLIDYSVSQHHYEVLFYSNCNRLAPNTEETKVKVVGNEMESGEGGWGGC